MGRSVALFIAAFVLFAAAARPSTTDAVGIVNSPVHVAASKAAAPIRVVVFTSAEEFLSQPPTPAQLNDLSGNADGLTVTFSDVQLVGTALTTGNGKTAPSRLEWRADMTIAGVVPTSATLTRNAQLVVNGAQRAFTYELTSKIPPLTWTLNQPAPAVALSGQEARLSFSVSAAGAGESTSAHITRVTLRDANNRAVDSDAISIESPAVTIGTPSPLALKVDGTKIPAGNYTGTVEVALDGAADAKPFDLAIASSSPRARLIGFFCVLFGVLLSIGFGAVLRNRGAYLAALLPARRIQDLLETERRRLLANPAISAMPQFTGKWIDDVDETLLPEALRAEGYIPDRIPAAFGATSNDAQRYAAFLQTKADEVARIAYLIESGFLQVERYTQDPAVIQNAFDELDDIARKRPSDVTTPTDAVIAALKAKAKAGHGTEGTTTLTHHVLVRLEAVNATAWLFFAVIATIAGYLAAVNVAGFGVMSDYLKAFLWGIGLQTAGTQLPLLTPASVASSIGIAMPKTT
jgi:hypothetical protein